MSKRRAYIFGAGGHAHVIASLIETPVTFVVRHAVGADQLAESEFFEDIEKIGRHDIYIGIGDNAIRCKIFDRLHSLGQVLATCVATDAFVSRDAVIGEGAVIFPGCVVNSRAVLGANTIINTLSSVDHDCLLGDHSQVTAGVTLGGTVKIGSNCFFGIKSAVLPNLTIGNDVVVMAGSLITQDIPDSVMVGGNPARIMRHIVSS